MQFSLSRLFCLLAAVTSVLAYPHPEEDLNGNLRRAATSTSTTTAVAGFGASRPGGPAPSSTTTKSSTTKSSTTKSNTPAPTPTTSRSTAKSSTTSSSEPNLTSSFINAICTNPSAHFPAPALSVAAEFCTEFLKLKPSTVQVTVTSTIPGGVSTVTTGAITRVDVRTTITVVITPPATTVTIPSTFTESGTTETETAPASTVISVSTVSVTTQKTTTVYTRTVTETKTNYVLNKRQNRGIFVNYLDSVISTACNCLVKSGPAKTVTTTVSTTKVSVTTITNPATQTNSITVTVTTELDEVTRSIFTTITLPGEDETVTVTPSPTTVTSVTTATITSTNTVSTVKTTTTNVNARPTNTYNNVYSSNSCCYSGNLDITTYSLTKNRGVLATDCQARCDASSTCKVAILTHYVIGTYDYFQCARSAVTYNRGLVKDPCQYSHGCQVFARA